jgi:diadenylate cyclase
LLRVLLIVLLLAAVVVFQSDLRRLLDRIGAWGFSHRADALPSSQTVNVLAEATAKMAAARTGALIAIRGAEPWDSHIQGGISLNGEVSRPLLYSIFAPDTPGHDGAVLLEGDRITKFGAHLPLAARLPEASRFGGTRHAAALGLAEECDALVIVVSEERGTISVAENGELAPLSSASELGVRLDDFWRRHYGAKAAVGERWWGRRSIETALLSLSLAILAWLLFAFSPETVQRTFEVPVAFRNLPPVWVLEHDSLLEAHVVLSGSEQAFELLDPEDLIISLDLADPEPGVNELVIDEDNLELPSELSLSDVEPREVSVIARRQATIELPVQVRTAGVLPDSLRLIPDPESVTVLVPEGASPPDRVLTEPIDLRRATGTSRITSTLVLPPGIRLLPDQSAEVAVRVERIPG